MNHFIFISEFAVYTFYHTSSGQWHDWTRCLIDMHQCRQGLQVPHHYPGIKRTLKNPACTVFRETKSR